MNDVNPQKASEREDPLRQGRMDYSRQLHLYRYKLAARSARGHVLDAACGNGYGACFFSAEGMSSYCGLDADTNSVREAVEEYGIRGSFQVHDLRQTLPFEKESFDTVCSLETIEHLSEEEQPGFLRELLRVLRPGGLLILSTPNRNSLSKRAMQKRGWSNPFHKHEFSTAELRRFLREVGGTGLHVRAWHYLGLPYNVSGAVHPHRLGRLLQRCPKYMVDWLDAIDLRLGLLFPYWCNCVLVVAEKTGTRDSSA
jgi:SAM-dependent methyltransferase